MPEHDLPPELRRRQQTRTGPVPLELPLDDELIAPPVPQPERPKPSEQRDADPFLRRS